MTDTPTPAAPGADGAAPTQQATPRLGILTQYVKDLSFENPRAPEALQGSAARPEIQVRVDVRTRGLDAERHEVLLDLNVDAKAGGEPMFMLELVYGGVFSIANVPKEGMLPVLLIECPRLLFPFARRVVADATRDGGFPPLMIEPIDFIALYRRRLQQAQEEMQKAQASAATTPPGGGPAN
jgi:preprotein translocase subunit SecB